MVDGSCISFILTGCIFLHALQVFFFQENDSKQILSICFLFLISVVLSMQGLTLLQRKTMLGKFSLKVFFLSSQIALV